MNITVDWYIKQLNNKSNKQIFFLQLNIKSTLRDFLLCVQGHKGEDVTKTKALLKS